MSISFSGLASGLDTSSWVESLTALKRAKVEVYQAEKENVLLSQKTLNSIKSFFSSFRATIEKITDTKFGIASMDLFSQNLALSSNLNILTATATTEAEEGKYDIKVNNLATNTQAASKYSYTTTKTVTATATLGSTLNSLGVKAGNIGVTVNGIERTINLSNSETIQSFTDKLNNIGAKASYNEKTGKFSVNLSASAFNDIDNTGIVKALHLSGVNEGYSTTTSLQIKNVDTVYNVADNNTKLSDLGAKAGTITIEANSNTYNVTIDNNTTIGDFVQNLQNNNIDAKFTDDGYFILEDAVISNEGTTNIIGALGLEDPEIYGSSQTSKPLQYATNLVETTTAGRDTLLKDIGEGTAIKNGDTVVVADSSNNQTTITLSETSTIGELLDKINGAGLSANIDKNGVVSISDGTIVGGTFDVKEALRLEETINGRYTTSNQVYVQDFTAVDMTSSNKVMISETRVATANDRIGDFLSENFTSSSIDVIHPSNGETVGSINIDRDMTFSELFNELSKNGINATMRDGIISFSSPNGYYINDSDINEFFGISAVTTTSTTGATVGIAQTSQQFTCKTTRVAQSSDYIDEYIYLGAEMEGEGDYNDAVMILNNGAMVNPIQAVGGNWTFDDLFNYWAKYGVQATMTDGVISVTSTNGNYLYGGIAKALGIRAVTTTSTVTTTVGLTNTSNSLIIGDVRYAGLDDKIGDFVDLSGDSSLYIERKNFFGREGFTSTDYTEELIVNSNTTFREMFAIMAKYDISATLNNGVISISNNGDYAVNSGGIAEKLGITWEYGNDIKVTIPQTLTSSHLSYGATNIAKASDRISDYINLSQGNILEVKSIGPTESIQISNTMTFSELFSKLDSYGITATMKNGVITFDHDENSHHYIDPNSAAAKNLGITTGTQDKEYYYGYVTSINSKPLTYTTGKIAQTSDRIADFVDINSSNNVLTINSYDSHKSYITVNNTTTFGELISKLENNNINAKMSNGVLSFDPAGYWIDSNTGLGAALGLGEENVQATVKFNFTSSTVSCTYTITDSSTLTIDSKIKEWWYVESDDYELLFRIFDGTGKNSITESSDVLLKPGLSKYGITEDWLSFKIDDNTTFSALIGEVNIRISQLMSSLGATQFPNEFIDYVKFDNGSITFSLPEQITARGFDYYLLLDEKVSRKGALEEDENYENRFVVYDHDMSDNWLAMDRNETDFIYNSNHGDNNFYKTVAFSYVGPTTKNTETVQTINTSTTFGDLGMTGNGTISIAMIDGSTKYITVTQNTTMTDLQNELKNYNIGFSIERGNIYIGGSPNPGSIGRPINHITNISDNIVSALKLSDNGNRSTTMTTTVNTGATYSSANINTATTSTTLGELGLNSTGNKITLRCKSGGEINLDVTKDTSIGDILNFLRSNGLQGDFTNTAELGSRFYLGYRDGDIGYYSKYYLDDYYLDFISDDILSVLGCNDYEIGSKGTYTVNINNPTSTISKGNVQYANLNTYMSDINKTGTIVIGSTNGSQTYTVVASGDKTIGQVFNELKNYGIEGSINENGVVKLTPTSNTFIKDTGMAFGLGVSGYAVRFDRDINNSQSNLLSKGESTTANLSTTMSQVGAGYIVVQSGNNTYTVNATGNATIGLVLQDLSDLGLSATISNGKVQITGNENAYVKDFGGVFGLTGSGYTTNTTTTISGYNTNSNKLSKGGSAIANSNSTMAEIGAEGNIVVNSGGQTYTVNASGDKTLSDVFSELSAFGISGSISNGKVTITGTANGYVTDFGGAFGLTGGAYSTSTDTTVSGYNTNSDQLKGQFATTITGDTTLGDLGMNDDAKVTIVHKNLGGNNSSRITLKADHTLAEVKDLFAQEGIDFSYRNGIVSIKSSDNDVVGIFQGDDVKTLFDNLNITGVNVFRNSVIASMTSNTILIPTTNSNTKLSTLKDAAGTNLGITSGNVYVYQDGVRHTVSIEASDTIGGLREKLGKYGIDLSISSDGRLSFSSSGDSYISTEGMTSGASDILEKLGIDFGSGGVSAVYRGSGAVEVVTTTGSDVSAGRDTKLSDLGVTAGEYNIYSNGVKNTVYVSSDDTLGDFIDTLKMFGIQTSLSDEGGSSVLKVFGSGNSYIAESANVSNRSNIVTKIFGNNSVNKTNSYKGYQETSSLVTTYSDATEETLLSEFDRGGYRSVGDLSVTVNGETVTMKVAADETIGSLLEKFRSLGLEATLSNGEIMIQSGFDTLEIVSAGSGLLNTLGLAYNSDLGGYSATAADKTVTSTTTLIESHTDSVANFANAQTKLSLLNITSGTLTLYRDGEKAVVQVDANQTFGDLQSKIAAQLGDVSLTFDRGHLTIASNREGAEVVVGTTTDTSNFSAITGVMTSNGKAVSSRALYCVNGESVVTNSGLFVGGDVTEGDFIVGNARIEIGAKTTMSDIIAQINYSDESGATAYWDTIEGKLVIKAKGTGASLINIEAGSSNFTDIMGYTSNVDGVSRMNVSAQDIGHNASFSINGTHFTSTSNTIGSDVTRIKGVTLNLKDITKEGDSVTLTIERDKETVADAVSDIVDAYNELIENVDKEVARDGNLSNESTLRLIRNQIRSLMTGSISNVGTFKNLGSVGISLAAATSGNIRTDNINVLSFDKDKFIEAFSADTKSLKSLLVGDDSKKGVLTMVEDVLEQALGGVSGYFASADKSYTSKVSKLDAKIEKTNKAAESYKARLEAKFKVMDRLIANVQNNYSSFLAG